MRIVGRTVVMGLAAWIGWAGSAAAHPHVWIVARATILYEADGRLAGIRHDWTFDKAYSAFAVQGMEQGRDGTILSDKLADLAKTNVESLAEFNYFTAAKANGQRVGFGPPRDYRLDFREGALTLRFTLPLVQPAKADRVMSLDLSDPSFFVDFRLAEPADAVQLAGAPAGCALRVTKPKPVDLQAQASLPETFWSGAAAAALPAVANKVLVACP